MQNFSQIRSTKCQPGQKEKIVKTKLKLDTILIQPFKMMLKALTINVQSLALTAVRCVQRAVATPILVKM